jgi:26S proteasome regulatory subunit N1
VPYVPDPENTTLLKTALSIYRKFNQYAEAMFVAVQLGDIDLVKAIFMSCSDRFVTLPSVI